MVPLVAGLAVGAGIGAATELVKYVLERNNLNQGVLKGGVEIASSLLTDNPVTKIGAEAAKLLITAARSQWDSKTEARDTQEKVNDNTYSRGYGYS